MHETLSGSPNSGLSRWLPTLQAHRHAGITGDPPVLGHHHRPMLRSFRVVWSTLKAEPLVAALSAPQRIRPAQWHSPPIIKGYNAIHERRLR